MQITSCLIVKTRRRPLGAIPTSAHNEKISKPFPQAHLTAECLCVGLRGEASDEDPPPPGFLLTSPLRCGERLIASLSVVRDHPINFGLGPEAMQLDGI